MFGRYGSGNTTKGETSVSGVPLADNDTTGWQEAANYHNAAGSRGDSVLGANAIAAAGGHLVASDYPADPTKYFYASGGGVQYIDSLSVQSGTLAPGTPVTVQFALQVAYLAGVDHSLPGEDKPDNYSMARGYLSSLVQGMHGSHYVDPGANKVIIDTGDLTYITEGLFTGTQYLSYLFDAEVGEDLTYSLTVDADTFGEVSSYSLGVGNIQNAVGQGYCSVAVAFGATVVSLGGGGGSAGASGSVTPDVQLISRRTGLSFPDASGANPDAALAAMPHNPFVPEPASAAVVALGLLAAALRRRRR